eukprot:TRINITY_DN6063_c0_g1_i2.p1 TRINITY_DN6063_c0_g1~~TRINITY_DN6063_c0_g1_i2.p1  ORF type:complete len:645 (-),score=154.20 TRINITY_DN6063_c0_g1_i2:95-2029(-)
MQLFFSSMRNKVKEFFKVITQQQPVLSGEFCVKEVLELFAQSLADVDKKDLQSKLESAVGLLDTYMKTISPQFHNLSNNPNFNLMIQTLCKTLLDANPKGAAQVLCQVQGLQALVPFYRYQPGVIQYVIEKLYATVSFLEPSDSLRTKHLLAKKTLGARRKTCLVLIHLATECGELFVPYLPKMYEAYKQLNSSPNLLFSEKTFILEALVIISNHVVDKQLDFILEVLGPVQVGLSTPEIQRCFSDVSNFVPLLLESQNPTSLTLHVCLSTLSVVWRRVNVPLPTEILTNSLPSICAVYRCLNSLARPEIRAQFIPVEWLPIFDVDEYVAATWLGDNQSYLLVSETADNNIRNRRGYMDHIRESCNLILESMLQKKTIFGFPNFSGLLLQATFANFEFQPHRIVKGLLSHVVKPLFLSCPPEQLSLVEPVHGYILKTIVSKLNISWGQLQLREQTGQKSVSEKQEVVEDKMLRDVSREYVTMLKDWFPQKNSTNKPNSHLVQYLISTESVAVPIFFTMIGSLFWPDSPTFRASLQLTTNALPAICASNISVLHQLAGELLGSTLKCLSLPHLKSQRLPLIGLITQIYSELAKVAPVIVRDVFLTVPGITSAILERWYRELGGKKLKVLVQEALTGIDSGVPYQL